jgi:hypothetical protein
MGRLPTWIIVAAVGAVVLVAVADGLRSTGDGPSRASVATTAPTAANELTGVLLVGQDCRSMLAIRLQDLVQLQLRGQIAWDCDGLVWSDDGTLYASCIQDHTIEGTSEGRRTAVLPGCAPAWRPDGALSVIHDGDLLITRRRGGPRVFFAREQLADALAGKLEGGRSYKLVEVAWHGAVAFFAIAEGSEPWQRAVIAYTPEGVTAVLPQLGQDISKLRVSPSGSFIAFTRSEAGQEIVMLDVSGQELPSPRIANALALAWSPDERWVAVSTRTTTFIARTGTRRVVLQLPAGGESLAWLPSRS